MIVGWDFEVFAVLRNNSMEARDCLFLFFARTVGYNGKMGQSCGYISEKVEVPPGEGEQGNTNTCCDDLFDMCTAPSPPPQKSACPSR